MTLQMYIHAWSIIHIGRLLSEFAEQQDSGVVLATPTFRAGAYRDRTRQPDVALFAGPILADPETIRALVPVLAVEIISPNNTALDMHDKVEEYLAAGVQLVWQVFPGRNTLVAWWNDRAVTFRPGDTITAEPVLPGFSCPVADLFPPPSNPTE